MNELFPIVILAGGLATRLGSLSKTIPKSLILVNDKPFIFYQLQLLKKLGFKKIILCIGYLGNLIEEYIKDGKQFGLSVVYSYDGEHLLGTAGAIRNALPLLEENFFILYGDSYLIMDYKKIQKIFQQQSKPALMTIFKNYDRGDSSNIEFSNNHIIKYDKKNKTSNMDYIDFGLSLFKKSIFSNNYYCMDLSELYQRLIIKNILASYEVFQKFYEVGSIDGINEFKIFIKQRNIVI